MIKNGDSTETRSSAARVSMEFIARMVERHRPPRLRMGIRLMNGMPIARAGARFRIECAKADNHPSRGGGE